MQNEIEVGRLPDGTGLSQAEPKVSALRASIPSAEALVRLLYDYQNIPSIRFSGRYPEFVAAREAYKKRWHGEPSEATFQIVLEVAEFLASGIAAGTDETLQAAQPEGQEHD